MCLYNVSKTKISDANKTKAIVCLQNNLTAFYHKKKR